jgi:selenocysteine-specific translation elongation factor
VQRSSEKWNDFRFDQCKKQILALLDIYQKSTLVIDAMDECDPQSRSEQVNALKLSLKESKKRVKIFISSRPD